MHGWFFRPRFNLTDMLSVGMVAGFIINDDWIGAVVATGLLSAMSVIQERRYVAA